MSILNALNPAQRRAAETIEGPLLVLAGAGSGKTRVLTYRIGSLVNEIGIAPWRILAVTFTNKAAGEMRERVEALVGGPASDIWIGTFHSICVRLLRYEAEGFGLDSNFSIYDEDDRRAVVRRILKANNIDERELTPRQVIGQISQAKNAMLDPTEFARQAGEAPGRRQMAELYTAYETELRRNNAFDFDDLLIEVVSQFNRHPDILKKYQERFEHFLVDEYQDTNKPQYMLCRQLSAHHRNICVVGDDDQSIYQFRGADIRNILDFERDYPDANIVRLEQNYRSTARILAAANAVIGNNQDRKGKELWTEGPDGDPVKVVECDSDRREARHVVDTIRRHTSTGAYGLGDAAILYRTNAQSRPLEEELQRSGLPYIIVGGIRFYDRKEIKDILSYLRLLINPIDDVTLRRIVNTPRRGIGDTSLERLQIFARERSLSLFSALEQIDEVPNLGGRAAKSLGEFSALLRGLIAAKETIDLPQLGNEVVEQSGYREMLRGENTPEAEARQQNIDQLLAEMTEYFDSNEENSLEAYLEEKSLMSSADENGDEGHAITLMTMHSAKGLEFPLVFVCGMEENLFPTARAVDESRVNPQAIEEERRLCYVGMTRAREKLSLTYALRRYAYGNMIESEPSRFLNEIPTELIETSSEIDRGVARSRQRSDSQRSAPPARQIKPTSKSATPKGVHYEWDEPEQTKSTSEFGDFVDSDDFLAVGQWVRHGKWGRGQILEREGHGEKMKLSIKFSTQVKRVAVAYAQLEPA